MRTLMASMLAPVPSSLTEPFGNVRTIPAFLNDPKNAEDADASMDTPVRTDVTELPRGSHDDRASKQKRDDSDQDLAKTLHRPTSTFLDGQPNDGPSAAQGSTTRQRSAG